MKKITLLLSLLLFGLTGFQAQAELWLIGALSPDGWVTDKGVAFTDLGEGNYTLDLEVTATGQQHFSLTTQLAGTADDWEGIRASRFGGGFEVLLGTETVLTPATDDSPYVNFDQAGIYNFTFNVNTMTLQVTLNAEIEVPPFTGTIYVTQNSVGNVYAWDADGNYGDWPGNPISSLETATVDGVDYYTFTYSHAAANPGLIFNEGNEMPQTADLVPEDGAIYEYLGGTTATVVTPTPQPTDTQVWMLGDFDGSMGWTPYEGTLMDTEQDNVFTATITTTGNKNWINFTKRLATDYDVEDGGWSQIAGYRIGAAQSNDETNNYVLSEADMATPIAIDQNAQEPISFQLPAGVWSVTLDLNENTITFDGEFPLQPEQSLFLVGSFNGWDPTTAEEFTLGDDGKYTIDKVFDTKTSVKFLSLQADWNDDNQVIYGAVSDGDFVFDAQYLDQPLTLANPGENYALPAGVYTFTVDKEAMTLTVSGEITPIVVEQGMFMVGTFNNWDAENPAVMEQIEENTYTLSMTFEEAAAFKFVTDNSGWETTTVLGADTENDEEALVVSEDLFDWPLTLASPGKNFSVMPGNYTFTVAPSLRDEEGYTVTISGEVIIPETHVYILGEIDGKTSDDWTPYEGLEMTTDDYVNFEAYIATTNDANYFNFTKVLATDYDVEDGGWSQIAGKRFGAVTDGGFADPFVVTAEQMGMPLSLSEDCDEPTSFMLPSGEWHLILDLMARTLTIEGDFPVPETHVYILGEVNDNGGWFPNVGTEMETDDYVTFTATVTTAGENWDEEAEQGYSYFSFSKALALNDADNGGWDEIGVMRFGALTTEADLLVTDDMLGQPLPLTGDGEGTAAFKLVAGQWKLTLDLNGRTLTIDKAALKGDVNGDGEVSVADVTMLVDLIMNGQSNTSSDVNGDGETGVPDITVLVDLIMSQTSEQ